MPKRMVTYTATSANGRTYTRNGSTRIYTHAAIANYPDGRGYATFASSFAKAEAASRAWTPQLPMTKDDLTFEIVEVTAP